MVGSREVGGLEQSRQTINSQFCGKGDSTFGMLKVSKLTYKNGIEVCVHITLLRSISSYYSMEY